MSGSGPPAAARRLFSVVHSLPAHPGGLRPTSPRPSSDLGDLVVKILPIFPKVLDTRIASCYTKSGERITSLTQSAESPVMLNRVRAWPNSVAPEGGCTP